MHHYIKSKQNTVKITWIEIYFFTKILDFLQKGFAKSAKFLTILNPLSANPIKWPNTLKQFVGKLSTNCLSLFDHFVKLALKGLNLRIW